MIRIFQKKPGRSKELCTSPKIGSEKKKKQQQQKRTKERKGKKEQSEIMTGRIMVCVGRERETSEGKKNIQKKLKIWKSKASHFPETKIKLCWRLLLVVDLVFV